MKYLFSGLATCLLVLQLAAQPDLVELKGVPGFTKPDYSTGYFCETDHSFRMIFQRKKQFTRIRCDSLFNVLQSYEFRSDTLGIGGKDWTRAYFMTNLVLGKRNLEVFANQRYIYIVEPDFTAGQDKLLITRKISNQLPDEILVGIFPGPGVIRIMTWSNEKNQLYLTSLNPETALEEKTEWTLPEANFEKKDKKEYPRDIWVRFSKAFLRVSVQPLKKTQLFSPPGTKLCYDDDKALFVIPMPFNVGSYVLSLDLKNGTWAGKNYFINALEDNGSDKQKRHKTVYSQVYDSLLIFKNAGYYMYEYYFYNIHTGQLLAHHTAKPENAELLIHSPIRQQGSWLSAKDKKETEVEKFFDARNRYSFIVVSNVSADSITFTNMAIRAEEGIEGALVNFIVFTPMVAMGLPSIIPSLVPPLTGYRAVFSYSHSKFSSVTFAPSPGNQATSAFGKFLESPRPPELEDKNTFLITRNNQVYLGFYANRGNAFYLERFEMKE